MNEKRKRLYKKKKTEGKISGFKRKKQGLSLQKKWGLVLGICLAIVFIGIICNAVDKEKVYVFSSRKYLADKGIKSGSKYNETFVEEAVLVKTDDCYLGKGTIDNENFYRFKVVKNGIESYDLEISDGQCAINTLDDSNISTPSVKVYKRSYDNGVDIYFYVISIKNRDIKDFGGE